MTHRLPPQLEAHHAPITRAFPRLASRAEARRFELRADQVQSFREKGFVAGIDVLDGSRITELRRRLEAIGPRLRELEPRLYEVEAAWTARPDEVVMHFLGGWLIDEWLHDLVFHPALTTPMTQLLGTPRPRLLHDQVFWKPARHPAIVPWHQDYSYWGFSAPENHATAFVALDDMDEESGSIRFVPGSHEWELLPWPPFDADVDHILPCLTEERRAAFRYETVTLRAGQMSIHHSRTIHGSGANGTDRPRRGLVVNYMHPDTRATKEGQPIQPGTPPFAAGAVIDGAYFPITLNLEALPA